MTLLFVSWFPGFVSGIPPRLHERARSFCVLVALVAALSAPAVAEDCNRNGLEDAEELVAQTVADCNGNGVPDECEVVPFEFGFRPETFLTGDGPRVVVVADLDGDGLDDLVHGHQGEGQVSTLSVLLADPANGFQPFVSYPAGQQLSSLSASDLDADGEIDFVSVHSTELLLFRGSGDGTLTEPQVLSVPKFTRWATTVDLNADGLPELVATNTTDDTLAVFANRGGLQFAPPRTSFVDQRPSAVTSMDLDGDGDVDLLVACADDRNVLAMINAGGTLSRGPALELGSKPVDLWRGDFDGSGTTDAVVSFTTGFALIGNPADGTLPEPVRTDFALRDLVVDDFDGDADLDVGTVLSNSRGLTLYANPGDGSFLRVRDASHSVRLADSGDFDGDGDVDLALTNVDPNRVNVLWNSDPGAIPLDISTYPTGGHSHALAVGDYDLDGDIDVATVDGGDRTVSVLFNEGAGTFARPVVYRDVDSQHLHHVIAEDLDRDGDLDLVAAGRGTARIWVLDNQGDGTFDDFAFYQVGMNPIFVASGDLDRDGDPDLVCANSASNDVTRLLNNGDGTFANGTEITVGAGPLALALGDVDGDEVVDLVVAETNASTVSVLRGRGDGTFGERASTAVSTPPGFVTLADLDADGDLDAITANRGTSFDPRQDGPGDLGVFLNNGGALQPERSFPAGHLAWSVVALDFDRDGILDLVSSSQQGNNASLLVGGGDGTFSAPIVYNVGESPRFILPADLNGDGRTDLVTSDRLSRTITVLLNRSLSAVASEDFLSAVCTTLDFHKVSTRGPPGGVIERVASFLLPARDGADLLAPLFPNRARFPQLEEFLRTVFPERFSALSAMEIVALWGRREARDYYSGAVRRLRLPEGTDGFEGGALVYGFDVETDGPGDELLDLDELRDVSTRLQEHFQLEPLVYAPLGREARKRAAAWDDPAFPVVLVEGDPEPEPPIVIGTPTFELEIAEGTELCGVFAEADVGRGLDEEYELKMRVRVRPGVVQLPTVEDSLAAELFEEVLFGPTRELVEAEAPGRFALVRVPGEVTTFRFTYEQSYRLSDGRPLVISITAPLLFRARGEEPLETRRELPPEFFVSLAGREPMQATLDGVPLVRFGSCTYETLTRWEVVARLGDGAVLRLDERYDEAESQFETAPATVRRAELQVAEETHVVTDYFNLVYSARRHNTAVEYRVIFDPPLNHAGGIGGIELRTPAPPERPQAEAIYLTDALAPSGTVAVVELSRAEAGEAQFVRGDANADGSVNLADAVVLLEYLFLRRVDVSCQKAADANADGRRNLLDPVAIVSHLFGRRDLLPEPFPACGFDASDEGLGCRDHASCR